MIINSEFFIHDHDKAALQALKAIPGFTQVVQACMKVFDEKLFHIANMSTNLRISEKQLPKYYNMLPPICERLGIDVPELYLTLDVKANAGTYGDSKPFIVITSGLIETLPDELIPTVLAHECGHIACRHSLYTTMGRLLLGGVSDAAGILGLGNVALFPIKVAFAYWMRCSEFSADRAEMVYNGSAEKSIEVCMRFAGLDKDIAVEGNAEAFLEQAAQYKELVDDSNTNKVFEFLMFHGASHPLNAVRAYECNEWQKSDSFRNIMNYLNSHDAAVCEKLPMTNVHENYVGKDYADVRDALEILGFTNIELVRKFQPGSKKSEPSQVVEIAVNGKTQFEDADWCPRDSIIEIAYFLPESEDEVAAAHPGQIQIPNSSKGYSGKNCDEVLFELKELGFTNISTFEQEGVRKGLLRKENSIARMTINGNSQFDRGDWVDSDATIRITYNVF